MPNNLAGASEMKDVIIYLSLSLLILSNAYGLIQNQGIINLNQVENLTGFKSELDKNSGIVSISFPHSSLKANAVGVKLTPSLNLTSWASFMTHGDDTKVIGQVVLLEDQVNLVLKDALESGLNVTALHNHYLWDMPRLMFMHFEGKGDIKDLASAIGKVFKTLKNTSIGTIWKKPPGTIDSQRSTLNTRNLEDALGKKGTITDGIYKVTWGRATQHDTYELNELMGIRSWAAFAGTDKEAVMLGDIAATEQELQNVLKALLKHNIFVMSISQHLLGESPKYVFVHYFKRGNALELASNLKETLTQINSTPNEKIEKPMEISIHNLEPIAPRKIQ